MGRRNQFVDLEDAATGVTRRREREALRQARLKKLQETVRELRAKAKGVNNKKK